MAIAIPHEPLGSPATLPRRALWALWGGLGAGAALAGAGTLAYLWPRAALDLGDAGAVADDGTGSIRYVAGAFDAPAADVVRRFGYDVVRRADGFVAFAAFCTHQVAGRCGIAHHESTQPTGTEGRFGCPCHGGEWRQDTGDPITTPPPYPYSYIPHNNPVLPLVSLPIAVRNEHLHVSLSTAVKYRQPGQPPLLARSQR
jgi:nitrite reductase/ring-hydroxylating ferredoxin subunit